MTQCPRLIGFAIIETCMRNDFLDSLETEYWEIVQKSMKLFPETLSVLENLKKKYTG